MSICTWRLAVCAGVLTAGIAAGCSSDDTSAPLPTFGDTTSTSGPGGAGTETAGLPQDTGTPTGTGTTAPDTIGSTSPPDTGATDTVAASDSGGADTATVDSATADTGSADSATADSATMDSATADSATADTTAVVCTDANSTPISNTAWTDIPVQSAGDVACFKIAPPDWAYATLVVKIQNNTAPVRGSVSVTGSGGFAAQFSAIGNGVDQTAILDLHQGNSVSDPHKAPYYVAVSGSDALQQIAWEMIYTIDTADTATDTATTDTATDTATADTATADTGTLPTDRPLVVGYVETMHYGSVLDIDYTTVDVVIHAFVNDLPNGTLEEFPNFTTYREEGIVAAVHAAGRKIVMSIGGATGSNGWKTYGASQSTAQAFAQNVVAKLEADGYDGVDLDLEFPVGGQEPTYHYNVVKAVYEAVKTRDPDYLVMFGVSPGWYLSEYRFADLAAVSDYLYYFGYDWMNPANGPIRNPTGAWSTYGGDVLSEPSVKGALDYIIAQGYPAERIILGIPFYATSWQHIAQVPAAALQASVHPDYREVYYNGAYWTTPEAARQKMDAVLQPTTSVLAGGATIGGIGFWEWGYENPTNPLMSTAIWDHATAY